MVIFCIALGLTQEKQGAYDVFSLGLFATLLMFVIGQKSPLRGGFIREPIMMIGGVTSVQIADMWLRGVLPLLSVLCLFLLFGVGRARAQIVRADIKGQGILGGLFYVLFSMLLIGFAALFYMTLTVKY